MTDRELLQALEPLKEKIEQFTATNGGSLSADEVQLMKHLYPEFQLRALNQLPRVFNGSCSSCIKETFTIYCSWYHRTFERIQHDELLNDMIKEQNLVVVTTEPSKKKVVVKKK